jgi:hypothetical protein
VTFNGYDLDEFVVGRTAAYVDQVGSQFYGFISSSLIATRVAWV